MAKAYAVEIKLGRPRPRSPEVEVEPDRFALLDLD